MTTTEGSAVRRRQLVLTDLDEATALLRAEYVEHRPAFTGDCDAFEMRLASMEVSSEVGWLRVDRLRHTLSVRADTDPAQHLLLTIPRSGRLRRVIGSDETSSTCLVPYWSPSVTEWDDLDAEIVMLDLDGVRRVGAEVSGLTPDLVEFTGWWPLSSAMARYIDAVVGHLDRSVLSNDTVIASPLVRDGAFRHLATTLLAAFPNTTQTVAPRPEPEVGEPATVRRAVDFMDSNARHEIDIIQIADAARIGPRGLQAAFRKHRDQTPLEYLRKVRMQGAHHDLEGADPTLGDTVAAIAAGWGFAHPGRFSVEYQRAYGRSPSDTLRR